MRTRTTSPSHQKPTGRAIGRWCWFSLGGLGRATTARRCPRRSPTRLAARTPSPVAGSPRSPVLPRSSDSVRQNGGEADLDQLLRQRQPRHLCDRALVAPNTASPALNCGTPAPTDSTTSDPSVKGSGGGRTLRPDLSRRPMVRRPPLSPAATRRHGQASAGAVLRHESVETAEMVDADRLHQGTSLDIGEQSVACTSGRTRSLVASNRSGRALPQRLERLARRGPPRRSPDRNSGGRRALQGKRGAKCTFAWAR